MSFSGAPRENPRAALYLGAMLGAFVGFWSTLYFAAQNEPVAALLPVAVVAVVALTAAALYAAVRRFAVGVLLGTILGTVLALLIGIGLLASSGSS